MEFLGCYTTPRGTISHLREEKPHFLFLEGSAGATGAAGVATTVPPDASAARVGTSAACAGTFAARASSVVDRLAAGACSLAVSAPSDDGGVGSHLSGEPVPRRLLPPPPMTNHLMSPGERAHAARAAGTPRLAAPGAHTADPLLSLMRHPLLLPPLRHVCARLGTGCGRVGPCGVHGHYLRGTGKASKYADTPRTNKARGSGSPLTNGPTGSMVNAQRASSSFRAALRSMARLARVVVYSRGKRSGSNCDCVRRGPHPHASRRCEAASPSGG
jgi:hypothetical protein